MNWIYIILLNYDIYMLFDCGKGYVISFLYRFYLDCEFDFWIGYVIFVFSSFVMGELIYYL